MTSKTVVVVGASRGIGKAIVERLARDPQHRILALARNVERMQTAFGHLPNVSCHALDLADKQVRSTCEAIFRQHAKIDVLINNAGALVSKPFRELSREDIAQCYDVNIIGVMQVTQAAVEYMEDAHIVNISS